MSEHFLGIDVGYSKNPRRKSTGLCLISIDDGLFKWCCTNTNSGESVRAKDLKALIPQGTTLSAIGIDGPLAKDLKEVNRYRSADALLTRCLFQKKCMPGNTKSRSGQCLHKHATNLANLVLELQEQGHCIINKANHPGKVHENCIVEVFPTAFLAVLIPYKVIPCAKRGKKSDEYWKVTDRKGYLASLIGTLAPMANLKQSIDSVENHDHRAALVCALAAMCFAKNLYVAVGDSEDGQIILPPSSNGRANSGIQPWAETTLQKNEATVRQNRRKYKNHENARIIRDGK